MIIPVTRVLGALEYCERAYWLDAYHKVKNRGGLPPNLLHDQVLGASLEAGSREWWKMRRDKYFNRSYYPAWARELLIYPAKDGVFKRGEDIVGRCRSGEFIYRLVFLASQVSIEAIGRKKIGLFVNPLQCEIRSVVPISVILLADAKSVIVLSSFLQESGWGIVDDTTAVPLEAPSEILKSVRD